MTAKSSNQPTTPPTADDDTTRLSYLPSTYPSPVQTSTTQTPTQARVNTAAVNKGANPVYCNQILIAVPVGPDAHELFVTTPPPTASVNTGKWSSTSMEIRSGRDLGLDGDVDYATFTFDCPNPSDFLINYDLVFGVAGQVSRVTGDSTVLIQEQSGMTNDPGTFSLKRASYTLTAYTPQFYLQNFVAAAPAAPTVPSSEFAHGAPIGLTWESNGTYFQIYQKGNATPIYSGSQTNYTVAGGAATDTTFVLVAMMSGNPASGSAQGGFSPIYLYEEFTVTVSNPDLTPKTAAVAGKATVGGTLGVTGQTTLANASVTGTLGVGGNTTLASATIAGALSATGATKLANANVVGKLAVGTADPPQQSLSVAGSVNVDQGNLNTGAVVNPGITFGSGSGEGIASKRTPGGNQNGLDLYTNWAPRLSIVNNGCVGIGTNNPTQAQLVVSGVGAPQTFNYGYLNVSDPVGRYGGTNPYSIWASSRVAATEFNAFSDERIKNIRGRSDGAADLRTLLDIEVTDYRYKDVFAKGGDPHKKLIAQQVEKFFPQAVGRQTEVVPDIYRQAPVADGWVTLATDLKQGERVRLIADEAEGIHEVLEVSEDKFRTDFKPEGGKVFVYGREVDDFRTIDYDAIAMLNVSATQQLKKEKDEEVRTLRAENVALLAVNDALTRRLEILESKMEAALNLAAAKATAVTA